MGKWVATAALGMSLLGASAAQAEDWWLVAGDAGTPQIVFVDVDSVHAEGAAVRFNALEYQRGGAIEHVVADADCSADTRRGVIAEFVCATPAQRMSVGLALGPLSPTQVVRTLWTPAKPKSARIADAGTTPKG